LALKKRVRILKKIRQESGEWRFISLDKVRGRYLWDKRPGYYFIEWWEGKNRKRQLAGTTPTEAIDASRRKSHELIGELMAGLERTIPEQAKGYCQVKLN
jgi:hypothetical protein